jgi:peroxiredoxin
VWGQSEPQQAGKLEAVSWDGLPSLTDATGESWNLEAFADSKILVVCFLGVECPLAKEYATVLGRLAERYKDQGVAFLGVDSNDQDTLQELAAFGRRHAVGFPMVKDLKQQWADRLGATRTPEVCVLDAQRRLVYRGRIDDRLGVGYRKPQADQQDLRDAIDQLLLSGETSVAWSQPAGCAIGRRRIGQPDLEVDYYRHIQPILQEQCVDCHRQGQIGPMALESYDDAASWSEMIWEVVRDQRMPPWHANPDHGSFANARGLSPKQMELLERWVKGGLVEGDRSLDRPLPSKVAGWQMDRQPDLELTIQSKPFSVPASGDVRYQYFVVDPKIDQEKWVEAAEILPGNLAVVHHVLVFAKPKGSRLDAEGIRGFLFAYVPGSRVIPLPKGMAKRLPADSELVFQVHYTPVGTAQTDQSRLGIWFAEESSVTHEVLTTSAVQWQLNIPPGDSQYQVEATLYESLPKCELISMSPHMHLRGKSYRYWALFPDGTREILLDIPHYDFNWQTEYRLSDLMQLPEGTKIHCEATFDNSAGNLNNPDPSQWVHWGDQTYEEMMIGYFHVAVPIEEASQAKRQMNRRGGGAARGGPAVAKMIFQQLDQDRDGKVAIDQVPPRLQQAAKRLDKNGDGILERSELP